MMTLILTAIGRYKWLLDVLLVGALVAGAAYGVHRYNEFQQGIGKAASDAAYAKRDAAVAEKAAQIEAQNREIENARNATIQTIVSTNAAALGKINAAAATTAAAGQRLRAPLAATSAALGSSAPRSAAPATGGAATTSAADLYANVQRRVDDATNSIAQYADQAHLAGSGCERAYDALSPGAWLK